jgi:nicotinate-nucleotide adenylyltransferase
LPRVGLFGGAFNPPHLGHLVCAQEVLVRLNLDRVILIPVGEAPHRTLQDDPGPEARFEMVELAVDGDSRLAASRVELDRPGLSYTAETLEAMNASEPDQDLTLILGGDQAAALPRWHRPERVLELADVAVVERVGFGREEVSRSVSGLTGSDRVRFVEMPLLEISSSDIRRRVAEGEPIRYLVPDGVADLIGSRGLDTAGRHAGASR